jgi:PAS domain S-box-containing protein
MQPDMQFLGGMRLWREDTDALFGVGMSAEIVAGASARGAEAGLYEAGGEGAAAPAAANVETVLSSLAEKGYGEFKLVEHDWNEGWLSVEARETFESRAFLGSGGLTDYAACDILRGLILGSYRFLRKRADLPAEDLTAVEIACAARGEAACRFAVGTPEVLRAHGVEPVSVDLTSRVELEEMLRKSREGESGLRKFIEEMPFGIVRLDTEGRVTFVNRKGLDMLVLPMHAAVGKHFTEFIHPDDRELVGAGFLKVVQGQADPYPTPCRMLRSDGSARSAAVDAFPIHDEHGRVAGYQAIALDLEDRDRLGLPGLRFKEGLRTSPRAYLEIEPEGRIRHANDAAVKLLGLGGDGAAVGSPFSEVISAEGSSEALRAFQEVATGKRGHAVSGCEVTPAGGAPRKVRVEFIADGLVTGRIERVLVLAEEASEREELLLALRESEEQLRLFREQTFMGIAILHRDKVRFVNTAAAAISGFTAEEVDSWGEGGFVMAIHPEDRAFVLEQFKKRRAGDPSAAEQYTFRMIRRSGETRWLAIRAHRADYLGEPATLAAFTDITDLKEAEAELEQSRRNLEELVEERTADLMAANTELGREVTERKQAEAELRFSEERLRAVFDSAMDGIVILERDSMLFRAANEAFCRMLGYSRAEVLQLGVKDIHPEDELPRVHDEISKQLRHETSLSREIRVKRKDGSVFYADINASPMTVDEDVYLLGVFRDMTERRAAEEKLRETEEKWQSLVGNSDDIIMTVDREGRISYINQTVDGFDADATVGTNVYDYIDPNHHDMVRETVERVFATGRPDGYIITGPGPDGREAWYETSIVPIRRDGEVASSIHIATDITERRRAEEALQDSEERFRTFAEMLPEIVYEADERGRIVFTNKRTYEATGYTQDAIDAGLSIADLLVPEDRRRGAANVKRVLQGEEVGLNEYTIRRRDGSTFPALVRSERIVRDDATTGLRGIVVDMSERKDADTALRESEELYRTLTDALPNAVTMTDLEGRITYISPRALEMIGAKTAEDILGRSGLDSIAPEDRERASANLLRIMEEGAIRGVEYSLLREDGERFPGELSAAVVSDAHGNPKGIAAITRDLTERKRAEEALLKVEGRREELVAEVAALRSELQGRYGPDSIIGQDPKMRAIYDTILAVGPTNATVLIQGETGTGKELVAKAIHYNSTRAEGAFVKVDCGALAETLLESELFGHVKGAYTGAVRERAGRFELAHEGTLFLDEVQNLSMPLQAKLLRVVQEGRFEKVGGTKTVDVDVRVVAATNEDLQRLVSEREFRKDLYYRLNVIPIQLPPLAERRGDVPLLARRFAERFAKRHGKDVEDLSQKALDKLVGYDWPGNVRELENIIEQAVVFSRGRTIEADEIRLPDVAPGRGSGIHAAAASGPLRKALEGPEKQILLDAIARTGGNKKEAAKLLGISRSALYEKLKRHGLSGKRKGTT